VVRGYRRRHPGRRSYCFVRYTLGPNSSTAHSKSTMLAKSYRLSLQYLQRSSQRPALQGDDVTTGCHRQPNQGLFRRQYSGLSTTRILCWETCGFVLSTSALCP
jgi:hypothetical protein